MKKLLIATLIVFVSVISGCGGVLYPTSRGNSQISDDTIVKKIVPNKTTMTEVRNMLGKPVDVSRTSNGETIWTYFYSKIWMGTLNHAVAEISFDNKGIVKDYKYGGKL